MMAGIQGEEPTTHQVLFGTERANSTENLVLFKKCSIHKQHEYNKTDDKNET